MQARTTNDVVRAVTAAGTSDVASLPKGPHSLSVAEVEASQRARILGALTELAAWQGIGRTTIGEVCSRARVSKSAFYAQFADKGVALLAAYDAMSVEVTEALVAVAAEPMPWREFIRAAVRAYLDVLERSPAAARLFIVESATAPPAVRARRREAHRDFAGLFRSFHEIARQQDSRSGASTTDRVYLAAAEGVVGLVASHLEDTDGEPVTVLEDDLFAFLAALFEGAGRGS